jgi:hypothetical protein
MIMKDQRRNQELLDEHRSKCIIFKKAVSVLIIVSMVMFLLSLTQAIRVGGNSSQFVECK